MAKPKMFHQRPTKRPKAGQRKKALAFLSKWAADHAHVLFIDPSSGLQNPGVITKVTAADGFLFKASSGAYAYIFPSIWRGVQAESIPNVSESIHIEDLGQTYTLAVWKRPTQRQESNSHDAEAQLKSWCGLKADQLKIIWAGTHCPTTFFYGRIAAMGNGQYVAKAKQADLFISFSLNGAVTFILEKKGEQVILMIEFAHYWVCVAETEMMVNDIIQRFASQSSAVH